MGADESSDVMFAKKLRRVEMCLEEAGIENHAVVRHNVFMNW